MMGQGNFGFGADRYPVDEKKSCMCMDKIVKALVIGALTVLVKVLADNWEKEGEEE